MSTTPAGPVDATSTDELRALQLTRLKDAVARVFANVPHYRRRFEAAGVHPDDLRSLDDLARFPFTTKDDLRACYPFALFAAPMEDIVRVHLSSGTTGHPTVVGYTAADIDTWAGLMARSLEACGGRRGDKVHMSFGYGLFTGGLGWHYGIERLGATVIPVGGGATDRQARLIRDLRPEILMATPSYALVIADAIERAGADPAGCGLRLAVCGAEPWSEGLRAEIEARLGVDAYDSYGLSEVIGPGVAQERTGEKGALTVWEDHFWTEIVDPATGRVLPEGVEGEAVFTTLTREGMPVIRYRSRDITRLLPPIKGPLRRMERVRGRSDDLLIVRGVNVYPSQVEAVLASEPALAPHYVLEISRGSRHLDEVSVKVESRDEADAQTAAGLGRRAEHLIKSHVGVSVSVAVVRPGTLERFEGKAKRVVDLRPRE